MDPFAKAPRTGQGIGVALLAAMTSLAAFGGGGGAAPTPPPSPAPAPAATSPTPIAAQLSVPTPVGYDADRLAAFNRLNEIRLSAGLGMLAQNVLMDEAAQAHAEWMVANDLFTHEEVAGTPGFSGADWAARDEAVGYQPLGGAEVMSGGAHGAAGIDALVNGVYHRAGMLAIEPVDVGIGWSAGSAGDLSTPLVVDMTRPGEDQTRGLGQSAQANIAGVAIWPIDASREVPTHLGLESPNPIPGVDVSTLGTPPSITVDRSWTLSVSTFVLIRASDSQTVPTTLLTGQSDPNSLLPSSYVATVTLVALKAGTTYLVKFSGIAVEFPSNRSISIDRTWSFTTAEK